MTPGDSLMSDTDKVLARATKLTRKRPPPPRQVAFQAEGNLLTWKPPADEKLFTHFRVRVGTDGTVVGAQS